MVMEVMAETTTSLFFCASGGRQRAAQKNPNQQSVDPGRPDSTHGRRLPITSGKLSLYGQAGFLSCGLASGGLPKLFIGGCQRPLWPRQKLLALLSAYRTQWLGADPFKTPWTSTGSPLPGFPL